MTITTNRNENTLTVSLAGRLDTTTSPELEKIFQEQLSNVNKLILNFEELEYISSAGLRILLFAQKRMNTQGTMEIHNVCEDIKEVFDITGFTDILTIV